MLVADCYNEFKMIILHHIHRVKHIDIALNLRSTGIGHTYISDMVWDQRSTYVKEAHEKHQLEIIIRSMLILSLEVQ